MNFYRRLAAILQLYHVNAKTNCSFDTSAFIHLLTLDNEVDVGDTRLVVGLEAAGVRPLVGYLHIVNVNGKVAAVVILQCHSLVQCPFVGSCEKDV